MLKCIPTQKHVICHQCMSAMWQSEYIFWIVGLDSWGCKNLELHKRGQCSKHPSETIWKASLFHWSLQSESMICSLLIVNVLANAPLQLDAAKLRKLRPVFKDSGSVTAGNSSSIRYSHLLDYLFPLPLSLTLFMFFQSTNWKDTFQLHFKSLWQDCWCWGAGIQISRIGASASLN